MSQSISVNFHSSEKSPVFKHADKVIPADDKRVMTLTMGCKVNTFESEYIASELLAQEYQRAQQQQQADLYVINTCTVTAEADRQARQLVRRAIRANPQAWVVVTGCYAERDPEACSNIPGVDLVVGNSQKLEIPQLIDKLYAGQLPPILHKDIDSDISLPEHLVTGYEGRSRAFLQIQQGCDQGCTFCIIHSARGPNRSFDPALIKRQLERLVISGYKEIVICGVDIGSYGQDQNGQCSLTELLSQLIAVEGDFRLRLSSIDPAHISDDLIALIAGSDKMCPQFHLSMQSGNTLILKRMKRRATRELLYERIQALREAVPEMMFSADIIVGFPTETEDNFADTLSAIEELGIAFPHVFAYSAREGTPAARIPNQVPPALRKQRAAKARQMGEKVWQNLAAQQIGSVQRVVIEKVGSAKKKGEYGLIGRADNYFTVQVQDANLDVGQWYDLKIEAIGEGVLIATQAR